MLLPSTQTQQNMSHAQTSSSPVDSQLHSYYLHEGSSFLYTQQSLTMVPTSTEQLYNPENHLATTHYHCIATVKGGNSYISSLAIGGKLIYAGSSNSEIRLWKRSDLSSEVNPENLTDNMVIRGKGAIKSLVVSANKIFSAHQDHKIRVWEINDHETQQQTLTHLATLPTLGDRASKLLMPKNHVQVRRHKKSTWVHHVDTVSALALSGDGLLLYSVSWDRALKIWRTTDFKCLESVSNAHDDAINALELSSNGDVYTGSADKKVKVWRRNAEDEKHSLVATLEKHKSGVNALALSPDENLLYSGASDRSIVVWERDDDNNMAAVSVLRGHAKSILCLTVELDLVCSGSADETIRIWKGINRCHFCLAILEGHTGPVKCLTLARDSYSTSDDTTSSYLIYSGSLDCDIKVWQIFIPLT